MIIQFFPIMAFNIEHTLFKQMTQLSTWLLICPNKSEHKTELPDLSHRVYHCLMWMHIAIGVASPPHPHPYPHPRV